jgi:hypothetical protein
MKAINLARTLAFLSLATMAAMFSVGRARAADGQLLEHVRTANDRFQDVRAAVAEDYVPVGCFGNINGGAMGVRYVNAGYLRDEAVDLKRPQALLYDPQPDGSMMLLGVQYMAAAGPANLEGQPFAFIGKPNVYDLEPFYELTVWAWKSNPQGAFADINPRVSCSRAERAGQPYVIFDLD